MVITEHEWIFKGIRQETVFAGKPRLVSFGFGIDLGEKASPA